METIKLKLTQEQMFFLQKFIMEISISNEFKFLMKFIDKYNVKSFLFNLGKKQFSLHSKRFSKKPYAISVNLNEHIGLVKFAQIFDYTIQKDPFIQVIFTEILSTDQQVEQIKKNY